MILCILQRLQLRSLPLGMDPTSKVRDLGVLNQKLAKEHPASNGQKLETGIPGSVF